MPIETPTPRRRLRKASPPPPDLAGPHFHIFIRDPFSLGERKDGCFDDSATAVEAAHAAMRAHLRTTETLHVGAGGEEVVVVEVASYPTVRVRHCYFESCLKEAALARSAEGEDR